MKKKKSSILFLIFLSVFAVSVLLMDSFMVLEVVEYGFNPMYLESLGIGFVFGYYFTYPVQMITLFFVLITDTEFSKKLGRPVRLFGWGVGVVALSYMLLFNFFSGWMTDAMAPIWLYFIVTAFFLAFIVAAVINLIASARKRKAGVKK